MTDVICITSSEDEEDPSNKQSSVNQNQKRKLSLSSNDENKSKRSKVEHANKVSSGSSESNKDLKSKTLVSPEKSKNENEKSHESPFVMHGPSKLQEPKPKECAILSNVSHQSNPVRKVIRPQLVVREKIPILESPENVFMKFVETCQEKKPSDDTIKIVNNLKKQYSQLNSTDKDDVEFQNFIKIVHQKIISNHNIRFYAYISEVSDEIKRRIKNPKILISSDRKSSCNAEETIEKEEDVQEIALSKQDMKKVRKLEQTIKKCKKKIKELEEKEVDFDEDEDSAYLQEDRYKRKLVELCKALSEIVGDRMLKKEIYKKKIKRKDISDEMTGITSVDEAIINFINTDIDQLNRFKHIKNTNAIADYIAVPDYLDILNCIKKCNEQGNLELTNQKMQQLAKTAFKSVGSYLKKQRVRECEEYMSSYIQVGAAVDPATKDSDLYKKLQDNKKHGDKKLEEIFQKYVDKQEGLSLEDLEKCNEHESGESTSEDNSDHKTLKKCETINSKHLRENGIISNDENDENDKTNVSVKSSESNKNNNEEKISRDKNNSTEPSECNFISDEKTTNDHDSGDSLKFEGNKSKDCDIKKNKMAADNADACLNKITQSSNLNTSVIENKEINSYSENKKVNNIPLVIDDGEVQILSDDNEENTNKSKSNNAFCNKERKKIVTIIDNTDQSPEEVTTVLLKIKETRCEVANVSKDNNENNSITSIPREECKIKSKESISTPKNDLNKSSKSEGTSKIERNEVKCKSSVKILEMEVNDKVKGSPNDKKDSNEADEKCKIKSKESISTPKNYLNKNSKPEENEKIKDNEVKCKSAHKSSSIKILEVLEITDDVEVLPDGGKSSKEIGGSENKEDKNSTSFIKVCSFAKPPDSWKNALSPEKNRKNLQLPIQQALRDLSKPEYVNKNNRKDMKNLPSIASTRLVNPLAVTVMRNKTSIKNVSSAKVTNKHSDYCTTLE